MCSSDLDQVTLSFTWTLQEPPCWPPSFCLCILYSLLSTQQPFYLSYPITPLPKTFLWLPLHSEIRAQIPTRPTRAYVIKPHTPSQSHRPPGYLTLCKPGPSLALAFAWSTVPPDTCRAHSFTSFRSPLFFPRPSLSLLSYFIFLYGNS